ncbi:MAG: DNA polymerase IV [Gammaproteobacteria bacterium]
MQAPWPRMIALVDMNAFFASVEQRDNPYWRGRPIAITNGDKGSCIITCSYEARAYGLKTGMRFKEGLQKCPSLIRVPTRPNAYADTSRAIMARLEDISPDIEVFSVDEAFLDMTHCQALYENDPYKVATVIKQAVYQASGLLCSVGVSGDRSTAKWAAKQQKPNGMTIIAPEDAANRLANVPVTDLCGINKGVGKFLAQYGVYRCGDMAKIPISVMGRRFGNPGKRLWLMAQGLDPAGITQEVAEPKSMGHGKVIPPDTRDADQIKLFLLHMAEKVGARLRINNLQAQHFAFGLRTKHEWIHSRTKALVNTDDGGLIYRLARFFFEQKWDGSGVYQVHILAMDPKPADGQHDLFIADEPKRRQMSEVIDAVNHRYGEFTLCKAPLINRTAMPNVIAPAWKPSGHRDSLAV